MGVVASKTFTAQIALLFLDRAQPSSRPVPRNNAERGSRVHSLIYVHYDLPSKMQRFLDADHPIEDIAQRVP